MPAGLVAQRVFDNLLNLEVNLISKPGMTARKMPSPEHALIDIASEYDRYLAGIGHRVEDLGDRVSVDLFGRLRDRAVEAERGSADGTAPLLPAEQVVILRRIYRNCDQIKGLLRSPKVAKALTAGGFDRATATTARLPLASDQLVTIRKVWEIGTETVLIQSVVQLDGDVVTRIQEGRDHSSYQAVHNLHQDAVGTAVAHWRFLAQTLAQFMSATLRGFFLGR